MRVSLKAISLSSATLWGGAMLFVGLIHMATPSYGGDFLRIMSSVYRVPIPRRHWHVCWLAHCTDSWMAPSPGLLFGWLYSVFGGGTKVLS